MYNSQIRHRKSIRIKEYNYSSQGMYFITICTKDRKCILSKIKTVGAGFHARPETELTSIGKIIEDTIKGISQYCIDTKIYEYVIMPNHVHMIIELGGHGNPPLQDVIYKIKSFTTKKYNDINKTKYIPFWQRNYYEHVIRNEKEYYKIVQYIQENPLSWELDKYYEGV